MRLELVTQKKLEYDEWRQGFNAWVQKQRESQSREYRLALARVIQDAYDKGSSVAQIMRAYGTTDRKTVTDLLALPLVGEAASTEVVEDSTYVFAVEGGGMFSVTDEVVNESVVFYVDDTPLGWYPYVEGEDAVTTLGTALNDPHSVVHAEAKAWLREVL